MINEIVILQPAGIGDILFCQKIAYRLFKHYNIIPTWPIKKEILWLKNYINAPVKFVQLEGSEYDKYFSAGLRGITQAGDRLLIPLWIADQLNQSLPIMAAKYWLTETGYENWSDYIQINRNYAKELSLYKATVNSKQYTISNRWYGTPPDSKKSLYMKDVHTDVEHGFLDDHTIFDWLMLYEKASEIHTVSTGTFYIFEALKVDLPNIHIYNRGSNADLDHLTFLRPTLTKNWIFHEQ